MNDLINELNSLSLNDTNKITELMKNLSIKEKYYGILPIYTCNYKCYNLTQYVLSKNKNIRIFVNKEIDLIKKIKKFFYLNDVDIKNIKILKLKSIILYIVFINKPYKINYYLDNYVLNKFKFAVPTLKQYNKKIGKINNKESVDFDIVKKINNYSIKNKKYHLKIKCETGHFTYIFNNKQKCKKYAKKQKLKKLITEVIINELNKKYILSETKMKCNLRIFNKIINEELNCI